MFAGAFTKGKAAAIQTFGTDAQKVLVSLLFEDGVQIISTFDMNRIASLTYSDDVRDELFDVFRETLERPTDYTVLTLQKTLIALRHIVIYGAEDCVNDAWALARDVEDLRRYNTVLIAQSNPNSALGFWHKLKGGGVDMGFPVREAAEGLYGLLSSRTKVRQVRTMSEDPNSIVPVGSRRDAAYMSDEARFRYLQRKMQMDMGMVRKSNLAKADSSFGGGYSAGGDGKGSSVVGAAHGIEEMIKAAEREQRRFVDAPNDRDRERAYVPKLEDFADVLPPPPKEEQQEEAPDLLGVAIADGKATREPFRQRDLFDDVPADNLAAGMGGGGTVDLLGVDNAPPAPVVDLLGGHDDLLGMSGGSGGMVGNGGAGADLLSMEAPVPSASSHDPFAPVPVSAQTAMPAESLHAMSSATSGPLEGNALEPQTSNIINESAKETAKSTKRSIMGGSTSQEAISALEELAALSLQESGVSDNPPPLPSQMPPPPPPVGGDLPNYSDPSGMLPPMPNEAPPPALPAEMAPPPPPPTDDDVPELPPPELMPPGPPPVMDLKDENLEAEFGAMGAMGGEGATWKPPTPPPEMPPPPPPPEPVSMGDPSMMMGGVAPQQSMGAPTVNGMGMMGNMGGMGGAPSMDMNAMMQAVQSGSMSQEEQQKLMQQMMLMMMMQQQQNQQGGP